MRSRQINFYLSEADQQMIDQILVADNSLIVLEARSQTEKLLIRPNTLNGDMGKEPLKILLARKIDVSKLVVRKIHGQEIFAVDTLKSPVIEYSRCFIGDDFIRRGRLYLTSSFFNNVDSLVEKDNSFLSWAQKIINGVKKNLEFRPGMDYCGAGALRAQENGFEFTIL